MTTPLQHTELRDPLFKGCTRPAMIFGVPLVPIAAVSAIVVLISVWTSILVVLALIPIVLIMRQIAKADDQQFRLLGLRLLFRGVAFNHNRHFWRASTYSPFAFTKRK